jgi:hypothetical protein
MVRRLRLIAVDDSIKKLGVVGGIKESLDNANSEILLGKC